MKKTIMYITGPQCSGKSVMLRNLNNSIEVSPYPKIKDFSNENYMYICYTSNVYSAVHEEYCRKLAEKNNFGFIVVKSEISF